MLAIRWALLAVSFSDVVVDVNPYIHGFFKVVSIGCMLSECVSVSLAA